MMLRGALITLLITVAVTVFSTSDLQSDSVTVDFASLSTGGLSVASLTATYSSAFSTAPSFAILLSGFLINGFPTEVGYAAAYGTPGLSSTSFVLTKIESGNGFLYRINLRWVATVGQTVQIFPIDVRIDTDGVRIYDVPFDYPTKVQWTAATTDVIIASVISSFYIYSANIRTYQADTTIAKWNGTAYDSSGTSLFVLSKDNLFGANCPFTTVGGSNVVKFRGVGFANTRIISTLFLIQAPAGSPVAAPSVVRNTPINARDSYSASLLNQYNTDGISPTAIRVFGMEYFSYATNGVYNNTITISTTDGIASDNNKQTNTDPNKSVLGEFYLSFGIPTASCPPGCICDASFNCLSCPQRGYWKGSMSVDANNKNYCECLPLFYLATDGKCVPCPLAANCATCELQAGSPVCTSCSCAKHRTLSASGTCPCSSGYTEDTPANAYCVRTLSSD